MGASPQVEVHTQDTLIRYTMNAEAAEKVKTAFVDMSASGESLSYMDCVLFDAALDVLGIEQEYYGYGDDEWAEIQKGRKDAESRFGTVRTVDVSDTWKEILRPDED